jgi:hypothetical protein
MRPPVVGVVAPLLRPLADLPCDSAGNVSSRIQAKSAKGREEEPQGISLAWGERGEYPQGMASAAPFRSPAWFKPLVFEGLSIAWSWKDTIPRIALRIRVVRPPLRLPSASRGLPGALTRVTNSISDGTAWSPVGSGLVRSKEVCWDRSVANGSACQGMGSRADWLFPFSDGAPRGPGRFQPLPCNACSRLCPQRFMTRYWNRKPMGSGSNIGTPETSDGSAWQPLLWLASASEVRSAPTPWLHQLPSDSLLLFSPNVFC